MIALSMAFRFPELDNLAKAISQLKAGKTSWVKTVSPGPELSATIMELEALMIQVKKRFAGVIADANPDDGIAALQELAAERA